MHRNKLFDESTKKIRVVEQNIPLLANYVIDGYMVSVKNIHVVKKHKDQYCIFNANSGFSNIVGKAYASSYPLLSERELTEKFIKSFLLENYKHRTAEVTKDTELQKKILDALQAPF